MSEITPALTAEEWAKMSYNRKEFGADIALNPAGGLTIGAGCYDYSRVEDGPERHALAALALHGQSFGFTREDTEFLRRTEELLLWFVDAGNQHTTAAVATCRSLLARIESLLPPEEP